MPGWPLKKSDYHIKENSWIAWIAAKKLKADSVAIVIGKTIHLHNASRETFLKNKRWLKHELRHVQQYREHGFLRFIVKYLAESIRHGYHDNKFEKEARQAEHVED